MMRYVHQSRKISRIAVVILWKWFCIKDSGRAILLAFCGPYLSPKYIARAISIHYYQHRARVAYERRIDLLIVISSSSPATHTCFHVGIFSFFTLSFIAILTFPISQKTLIRDHYFSSVCNSRGAFVSIQYFDVRQHYRCELY